MNTLLKVLGSIALIAVIAAAAIFGFAQFRQIQSAAPQGGTVLGSGSSQTGSDAGYPPRNDVGTGQQLLPGDYNKAPPARTWADWPSDRINPEESKARNVGETNWEDLTDLLWRCLVDGKWEERTGARDVNDNGQKLCILLSKGPFGLTGMDVLKMLVKSIDDRAWVVRVTPEAAGSGGAWTLEAYKPGHTPSMIPGLDVPSGGHLLTLTLQPGRTDYWGGFDEPHDPNGFCDWKRLVDADSGLDQWQVVCREAGATIESDGLTWWPDVMYFDDYSQE